MLFHTQRPIPCRGEAVDEDQTMAMGLEADLDGIPCPPSIQRWLGTLSTDLLAILQRFAKAGHGVWLVGGCVRDAYLGHRATDIDLCTSCPPEQTMTLFGEQAVPTGIDFGTITLKGRETQYEVTTLRTESLYRDGRRPDQVMWGTSLKEDLSRRDFTINSMAVDVARGLLYDPFQGDLDIKGRCIRAVGDAQVRCEEDALRILRAYRFMNMDEGPLWTMDSNLSEAVKLHQPRLRMVAIERRWMEMSKILAAKRPGGVLLRMNEDGALRHVFEEEHHLRNGPISMLDEPPLDFLSLHERIALLMIEWDTKSVVRQLKRLKVPNALLRHTAMFHERLAFLPEGNQANLRVFDHVLGDSAKAHLAIRSCLSTTDVYIHGNLQECQSLEDVLTNWLSLPPRTTPETCLVDGHWIMARSGIGQGLRLGRLKSWLHRIQIEEDLTTQAQIETVLSRIPFNHGDHEHWPQVSFP